jgi:hypothetical protein
MPWLLTCIPHSPRLRQLTVSRPVQGLPNEEYRFVRATIISIVLATDMVGHARLTKVPSSPGLTTCLASHLDAVN